MPGAGGAGPPPPPPGYDTLAQFAFQQGRETDAFKYLYAFALTNDAGAGDVLAKIEWVNGLKSPTLGVRWAAGVQVTPDSFKTDVKPVGTEQQLPRVGRRAVVVGEAEQGCRAAVGRGEGTPGMGSMRVLAEDAARCSRG